VGIICIVFFASACCFWHRQHVPFVVSKLLNYWAGVFGASVNCRYIVIIWSVAFLMSQIYSNGFTSIITIALPQKGFEEIKQLLDASYKILFTQRLSPNSYEWEFGKDFKVLGLSIHQAFLVTHDEQLEMVDLAPKLVENGARLALIFDIKEAKIFASMLSKILKKNHAGTYLCFTLQQTLSKSQLHWMAKTENQYWVKTVLQRMPAAGLNEKWSEWHYRLQQNLTSSNYKPDSDVVNIVKVRAMLLIWWVLISLSVGSLCLEVSILRLLCAKFMKLGRCVIKVFTKMKIGLQNQLLKRLGRR